MLDELVGRRVLLLQGPVGPFFRRFAEELESHGAKVFKVNFNAGDALFYLGKRAHFFAKPLSAWPEYLERLIAENRIEAVCLFGDRRPFHKVALPICERAGVPAFVFEEGYLRPDYITMERGGVNGSSPMSRDPDFYRGFVSARQERPLAVHNSFLPFALYSVLNALAHSALWWAYPAYKHHRSLNVITEAVHWGRSGWRKLDYRFSEREMLERLSGPLSRRYFLVALQVHLDAQLEHTRYRDIAEFLDEVIASFARNAEPDARLVIKHHPLDRGYRNYGERIAALGRALEVEDRLIYVHDVHLPTLIKHALGVVMMNSTVGLSALFHGTPVKLLGKAVYDLPGLTYQGSLDEFWKNPGSVDPELYQALVAWMVDHNQLNGSFYRRLAKVDTPTGVRWP
ncbi:MAG: capsular biosynthesis protein [Myxococcota bacterium]|jgi:capsule polysaccharide modification protein KpsS|nr:capsular biosynthesis protein [Myxococcota bacterium]